MKPTTAKPRLNSIVSLEQFGLVFGGAGAPAEVDPRGPPVWRARDPADRAAGRQELERRVEGCPWEETDDAALKVDGR